ncbi:uncharacterized protein LOC126236847 isoform X1 [Schistocerca nitens]|uniref:uncharacterized protein LOC126236847 isoform X1 n=1 Tax=Schistocerca nitens TaxID=7011 RepID=UPI0021196289|nr:uncharacterized protein LOC126236847 isoform X1 [Schistocerca nitens]XP_049850752.1 uncharacterized protein LOC126323813 isoform X1 [Schistocerca gregaria]
MPASGPVYQPTTETYEQQRDWTRVSYLSQTVSNGINRTKCLQWVTLVLGLFALAAGLIMLIEGAVDYSDTRQHEADESGSTSDLVIAVAGAILIVIGFVLIAFYVRTIRRRKSCFCFDSKEQRLARQLDNQASNGQVLTLNPSTDLLVTAQYAPVSEISYQPPAVSEEEETRKLMGSDNKECSDSVAAGGNIQSMITTKMRKISSTSSCFGGRRLAPLASGEDVTPSLRSSFASVYYNMTPYPSDLSLGSSTATE